MSEPDQSSTASTAEQTLSVHGRLPAFSPESYSLPGQFLPLDNLDNQAALCQAAAQVLSDPLATLKLSERVLELLRRDLELQKERSQGSHGRRW